MAIDIKKCSSLSSPRPSSGWELSLALIGVNATYAGYIALGAGGATAYVTGRTAGGQSPTGEFLLTLEDTVDEVTTLGGRGVALSCEHTKDTEVLTL